MRLSVVLAALALCVLAGCGRHDNASQLAVAIAKGDICVVCGMEIDQQPGPRAEAYVADKPIRFGSTRDFFGFVIQPDVIHQLGRLYVQDSARIDWQHPANDATSFTEARNAWYVAWQPLPGEMGPTFASFAHRADAEIFRKEHGGALLRFNQVTASVVTGLTDHCPGPSSSFEEFSKSCIKGKL